MTISEDCFAPFDLSKTRKFDRKKDQESLRKSFYKLGVQYFEVSCFTIKNLNWMPVTLANVAFSCELLLKAILYGFGVDFSKTHGLKGLFEKLPQNEQEYISKNIAIENREKEFYICLQEQDQAFPEYRYMCEAKAMSANPKFLFAFAHILKFVYDNRPEALLTAMGTAPAEVVVCDTVAGGIPDFHLPQEKRPFQPPFLAHSWHGCAPFCRFRWCGGIGGNSVSSRYHFRGFSAL